MPRIDTTHRSTPESEYIRDMKYFQAKQSEWFNSSIFRDIGYGVPYTQPTTRTPTQKLTELKRSIKQIEAEPFTGEVRRRITDKVGRLHNAGAVAQASVLEHELTLRDALIRLKEWDYKILTQEVIRKFESSNHMTLTEDGLKIHIDPIEQYVGNPQDGQAKDRIIPDVILDKLEEAKEREVFDGFEVLWAERVKDPLLLGCIHGCEDYFFICEWGDDITFEQITKGE